MSRKHRPPNDWDIAELLHASEPDDDEEQDYQDDPPSE